MPAGKVDEERKWFSCIQPGDSTRFIQGVAERTQGDLWQCLVIFSITNLICQSDLVHWRLWQAICSFCFYKTCKNCPFHNVSDDWLITWNPPINILNRDPAFSTCICALCHFVLMILPYWPFVPSGRSWNGRPLHFRLHRLYDYTIIQITTWRPQKRTANAEVHSPRSGFSRPQDSTGINHCSISSFVERGRCDRRCPQHAKMKMPSGSSLTSDTCIIAE
jgi:hypothetical protein